ncbi:MAG: hypothetical protein AAF514_02300, partial [Verrucomicrobiota bacterium]
ALYCFATGVPAILDRGSSLPFTDLLGDKPAGIAAMWLAVTVSSPLILALWWQQSRWKQFAAYQWTARLPSPFGLSFSHQPSHHFIVRLAQVVLICIPVLGTLLFPVTKFFGTDACFNSYELGQAYSIWHWDPENLLDGRAYHLSRDNAATFIPVLFPLIVLGHAGLMAWLFFRCQLSLAFAWRRESAPSEPGAISG